MGTLTTGTWNASVITGQYGGTGVANTGKSLTLGGDLTTSGAFASTFTMTAPTSLTFPVSGTLATQAYADAIAAGLEFKNACVAGSTAPLTVTYNNNASGIGATLTNAGAQVAFSIDGQSPSLAQRILIKNQASTLQNGIYTVTVIGDGSTNWVLTRALDYDQPSEIHAGDLVAIESGTVNANTLWLQTQNVATIGTDAISFSQFASAPLALPVSGANGGTGVANTSKTITLGGNLTTSGAFASTFTMSNTTSVTFPVSGTLATTAQVITSVDQASGSATLAPNNRYICDNGASLITFTLPVSAAVGDTYIIVGGSSGGWTIAQLANQIIHVGSNPSTTGATGSVASSNRYDCVILSCVVANLEWSAYGVQGSPTVV